MQHVYGNFAWSAMTCVMQADSLTTVEDEQEAAKAC